MSASTTSPAAVAAFSKGLAEIVERTGPSVLALHARRWYPASGFLWQPGVLLTAAHVIRREGGITAVLPDGNTTAATLVGVDPGTDIAVLRVESSPGTPAALDEDAKVRPGHFVVAVARGTDGALAASSGIVARAGGEWRTWRGGLIDQRIQLDGGLWPGFSGGPVVNAHGQVIGMGTSALARGRGVVIPGSVLRRVAQQLLAHGRAATPYIGASMQSVELPANLRERLGLGNAQGLIVLSVASGGPAEAAGITLGDVLVSLDDSPLSDIDHLRTALAGKQIGALVHIRLVRGGELVTLDLKVGERPSTRY